MKEVGERFQWLKDTAKVVDSYRKLSEAAGKSPAWAGMVQRGDIKGNIPSEPLLAIAAKLGLRERWILTGEGPPFVGRDDTALAVNPDKEAVIALVRDNPKIQPEKKARVLGVLERYHFKDAGTLEDWMALAQKLLRGDDTITAIEAGETFE